MSVLLFRNGNGTAALSRLGSAAAAALSAVLVTACGVAASTSNNSPATATAAPAPSGTSSSGATSAAPRGCPSSALKLTLQASGTAAAGSYYATLDFSNISGSACTMDGYPGVSFVTAASGRQIGPAAHPLPGPRPLVRLAPQAVAHATLQVTDAAVYPASRCHPVTARVLRVVPPGQLSALHVRYTARTCALQKLPAGGYPLIIFPIRPGKGRLGQP